jgi:hypothetical protein
MWLMAQSFSTRPSELAGSPDVFTAFCLDRAVWTFGRGVETAMDEAENRLPKSAKDKTRQNTRQRVLDRFLGVDQATAGRFRNPQKG